MTFTALRYSIDIIHSKTVTVNAKMFNFYFYKMHMGSVPSLSNFLPVLKVEPKENG